MIQRLPRTTPLAAALFTGLFGATAASAAPTVGAVTSAEAPIGTPGSTSPFSSPGYANSSSSADAAQGKSDSYAFSSETGAYAVSSSAHGNAQSTAAATFSQTIVNNTGSAQHYYLTMKIYGGNVGVSVADPAGLITGETLRSYYQALVTADAVQKFYSTTEVKKEGTDTYKCTHFGVVLTGAGACVDGIGYYSWSTDYYTIDLGIVGAGDDLEIKAELAGASIANVGTYDFGNGNGGYGYGYGCFTEVPFDTLLNQQGFSSNVVSEQCVAFKGYASQFYGDPQQIDDTPIFGLRQTGVLPVPATPLLVGLGLGAIGWTARRRKKSAERSEDGTPPPG
jgi:hypothetical protein